MSPCILWVIELIEIRLSVEMQQDGKHDTRTLLQFCYPVTCMHFARLYIISVGFLSTLHMNGDKRTFYKIRTYSKRHDVNRIFKLPNEISLAFIKIYI